MTDERSSILVATDGSASADTALGVALELAGASRDRIVVIAVWNELRSDFGGPLGNIYPDLVDSDRGWAKGVVATAAKKAEAAGVEVETLIRHGVPADEICAAARERQPRMVVVGSQGWSLIERVVFGSVSSAVLHHAPCPVLVVPDPATAAKRGGRALNAVAGAREEALT